jgi:hypothetical protein
MANKFLKINKFLAVILLFFVLILLTGCAGIFYIPGASYGYYIWEEDGIIFVEWSTERKDAKFDGLISTDGDITSLKLKEWEKDEDVLKFEEDKVSFTSTLSIEDYSDGFNFALQDYNYIEFDLKMNDGYDLSRINLGGFLESPGEEIFRIEKDYLEKVQEKPWYKKRPFSEFFYKLFSNKYFTFLYLTVLGIIIIEILRITVIARKKKKAILIAISYALLAVIEFLIYFILKFFVR